MLNQQSLCRKIPYYYVVCSGMRDAAASTPVFAAASTSVLAADDNAAQLLNCWQITVKTAIKYHYH